MSKLKLADETSEYWKGLNMEAKLELMTKARTSAVNVKAKLQEKYDALLDAIGALSDPEGQLVAINPGPERDELQTLYDAERGNNDDVLMPYSGSMERKE